MAEELKSITSPLPGIFYRRLNPTAKEYVQEGDLVQVGDTVGMIEIMKNFYEVKSEFAGRVHSFAVNNEELIDIGQEIVRISVV